MNDLRRCFETLESRRLLASIVGAVMQDFDGDGQVDAGERSIAGVTVFIDGNANDVLDAGEVFTTTTQDGYQFTVDPGTYRVAQVGRVNSLRTFPGDGRLLVSPGIGVPSFSNVYELNRATGRIAQDVSFAAFERHATIRGDYIYTYVPPATGMPGRIFRQHLVTRESSLVTLTDVNVTPVYSAILGDELFLRYVSGASPMIAVLDLATGVLRRTLTCPGNTFDLAAMPDYRSLLVANASELLWLDPETGAVTHTIARSGPAPLDIPFHVAYLNGSAYLQWSTSGYARADVLTGVVSSSVNIEGGGVLLTNDSTSHVVTVEALTSIALADFQQGEYSTPAEPPILLSATSGLNLGSALRVAINGTTAGAQLMIYHAVVSSRDRKVLVATASEGTTILEFNASDIVHVNTGVSTAGIAVLQTEPFKLVQPHVSETLFSQTGPIALSYSRPPGSAVGWTNEPRPRLRVLTYNNAIPAMSSADIALYANGTRVATAPAVINNSLNIRPDQSLSDGRYGFTALARVHSARPGAITAWQDDNPLAITLNIDQTAPTAAFSYAFESAAPAFLLTLSEPSPNAAALSSYIAVARLDVDGNVVEELPPSAFTTSVLEDRIISLAPAASVLPDGVYRLTLAPAAGTSVTDRAGNPLSPVASVDVFVLAGDVNRDRAVNFDDLLVLAQNYGQTGRTFSQGNIDYSANGKVDFDDLLILAQRYGTSLVASSPLGGPNQRQKTRNVRSLAVDL